MTDFIQKPSGLIVPAPPRTTEPEPEYQEPVYEPEDHTESWPDICYVVDASVDEKHYGIEFKVYVLFSDGSGRSDDVVVSGRINRDGCTNLFFEEDCMHRCERQELANIGILLVRIHELAEILIDQEWRG